MKQIKTGQHMKPRSIDELTKEYNRLCLKAGDLAYRITSFDAELKSVQGEMRKLNKEASELQSSTGEQLPAQEFSVPEVSVQESVEPVNPAQPEVGA